MFFICITFIKHVYQKETVIGGGVFDHGGVGLTPGPNTTPEIFGGGRTNKSETVTPKSHAAKFWRNKKRFERSRSEFKSTHTAKFEEE